MSPGTRRGSVESQLDAVPPNRKRRRIAVACVSCRKRKSRCGGQRPRCGTCTELDLQCEYISSNPQGQGTAKEHIQRIEARLHSLEQVVGSHLSSLPESCRGPSNINAVNHLDIGYMDDYGQISTPTTSPTNPESSPHDEGHVEDDDNDDVDSQMHPEDPTDGMGHFVFEDEEDRAFFGPSSSIAFTSEVSVALARLSLSPEERTSFPGPNHIHDKTILPDYRIARIPRRKSVDTPPDSTTSSTLRRTGSERNGGVSPSSIFYLPPKAETSALIDRYFSDTALLFPYIHEGTFRDMYAGLPQGKFMAMRRTWLGLLNMVLAMATYTTVSPNADAKNRHLSSEAFYRRASRLCESHVMKTASLEIVQYLLLVTQYMQGNKSSVQTSATHGLAVKIAMQLGLHSTEASKTFPPMEREIRRRVWFGCIVLDRSLSMTFGRPASIPETYCRLDLPIYIDPIDTRDYQPQEIEVSHGSTDFFRATINLYSVMGNVIDLLYGGNLGCGEKLPNYELTISIMKVRRMLEGWARQLPPHMGLIHISKLTGNISADFMLARFRMILTLRFNNVRILAHRIVLVRVCELVADSDASQTVDLMELRDVAGNAVEACVSSSADIVNLVGYAVRDDAGLARQLLGAWWFTLYYVFDAGMVLFTILLLLRRSHSIALPPSVSQEAISEAFFRAIETLSRLDQGNITVERCFWCLKKLCIVLGASGREPSSNNLPRGLQGIRAANLGIIFEDTNQGELNPWPMPDSTSTEIDQVPTFFQEAFKDQGLSFLDFDFMGNERLDFMGDYYGENPHDL